jgi:hypothetical protein
VEESAMSGLIGRGVDNVASRGAVMVCVDAEDLATFLGWEVAFGADLEDA